MNIRSAIAKILVFAVLAAFSASTDAQGVPGCPSPSSPGCIAIQPFVASGKATITATSITGNVALGTSGALSTAVVSNAGAVDAWVAIGGSSIAATVGSGTIVPAGGWTVVAPLGPSTYIAAITSTSTAALTILTGTGVPVGNPLVGTGNGPATNVKIGPFTIIPLDVATVTTGQTAITALVATHASGGGFIITSNTAGICVDQTTTAGYATGSPSTTTCVAANQPYYLVPSGGAVSVNSTASSVALAGWGLQ